MRISTAFLTFLLSFAAQAADPKSCTEIAANEMIETGLKWKNNSFNYGGGYSSFPVLSTDQKSFVALDEKGNFVRHDIDSKKNTVIVKGARSFTPTHDGFLVDDDKKIKKLDSRGNLLKEANHPPGVGGFYPSSDPNKFFAYDTRTTTFKRGILDLKSQKFVCFDDVAAKQGKTLGQVSAFSPDGKYFSFVQHAPPVSTTIFSVDGKKVLEEQGIAGTVPRFSMDGKKVVLMSSDGKKVIKADLGSGKRTETPLPDGVNPYVINVSPDGKFLSVKSGDSRGLLYDLNTGKHIEVGTDILNFDFKTGQTKYACTGTGYSGTGYSGTGYSGMMAGYYGGISSEFERENNSPTAPPGASQKVVVVDLEKFEVVNVDTSVCPKSEHFFGFWPIGGNRSVSIVNDNIQVIDKKTYCVGETLRVASSSGKVCAPGDPLKKVGDLSIESKTKLLCSLPFSAEKWNEETPLPPTNPMTKETAKNFLLRFQKPGGFEPEKHLEIFNAILKSDLAREDKDLINGAMQNILLVSPGLYDAMLKRLSANELSNEKTKSNQCRTAEEEKKIADASVNYVQRMIKERPQSDWKTWKNIYPLTNSLAQASSAQKNDLRDQMAESLTAGAATDFQYRSIFPSKLYKFSYQATAKLFGEQPKGISDLTLAREGGTVTPMIFGVAPINGDVDTRNNYGFYSKSLSTVYVQSGEYGGVLGQQGGNKQIANKRYDWVQNGKPFSATMRLEKGEVKVLYDDTAKAPNYDSLWKDGNLNGLVIAGSNLGSTTEGVMDEYLSYYQNQGFTFAKDPKKVDDLKAFLMNKVSSGEMDYLIKEAHSDGDDMNLFRMDKNAKVLVGTKTVNGKTETIQIVYPDHSASGPSTVLLSNKEFADSLEERTKNSKGQLIYMNTSCWSTKKAANEIEAAKNLNLVVIPAKTMATTFSDSETDAERIILDGIRNGKTYEEIREGLRVNPEYSAKTKNYFLFPDSPEYKEEFSKYVGVPLDIDLKIHDDLGESYNLDQVEH